MGEISTIGLDIAKHVFQVHGVDTAGQVVVRRQLRRSEVQKFFAGLAPALIGMEACATSHYWARELRRCGHEVRLMPAQYVKAYVKRQKNDAADAEAICEAVRRPTMRFVPVKSEEQQSALMLHRCRDLLIRQRTMLVNALRGHLAEFGMIEARGLGKVASLIAALSQTENAVPPLAHKALEPLAAQLHAIQKQIERVDAEILRWHKQNQVSRRLATIPGIGPVIASAIAASVPDAATFSSARQFAAWVGLVPRQNSTGGKPRLGRISKQGDAYLRRLLIIGAQSVLRWSRATRRSLWTIALLDRRPRKVAAVALANKMARVAWALMVHGEDYRRPEASAA
ncbi:MAG: IS110 family transposase [Alphaproteobacteria bacterium]|nr:IS110 family transposase [Alphaproteobacteria bacterium]